MTVGPISLHLAFCKKKIRSFVAQNDNMNIGEYNTLRIDRFTSVGAYLENEKGEDVLLPNKYLEHNWEIDDEIQVFVYTDSEDRPVATTEVPFAKCQEFAWLAINSVTNFGAFADIGLEKDLFIPLKEQNAKLEEDKSYLIYVYLDEKTQRMVGSAKINPFIQSAVDEIQQGDEIDVLIANRTDLGYRVIINQKYLGLLFEDHIIRPIESGETCTAYAEHVRLDGKIDISLVPLGFEKFEEMEKLILNFLQQNDGRLHLTDKSDPEEIKRMLGMSKKLFKKSIGGLYKKRIISILEGHIELREEN
jgi:predicted RNA-binding protein (virulence factor B family)